MNKFLVLIVLFIHTCKGLGKLSKFDYETKTFTYTTDKDINMILLGDWGGMPYPPYTTPFEFVTAKRIMQKAVQQQSDFLLALGDNFYFDGVTDEHDRRFKKTFENVFNEESFQRVPWFVVGGNHDHYGNITGQIEYSKHSHRWNFPSLWYTVRVRTPEFNMTILMIDTVEYCGNTKYEEEYGQPDEMMRNYKKLSDQREYIEQQLKNNNDSYIFVAGHFPVWSMAEHGPTKCLVDDLRPLLVKYNVSGYFCGHDHNLQHIRENSVEYVVSGAGDMVNPSEKHRDSIPDGSLMYFNNNLLSLGGFTTLHVGSKSAHFVFETGAGSTLYKYEFAPRNNKKNIK